MANLKRGLGKGLGALIDTKEENQNGDLKSGIIEVDINKIEPNKNQPRQYFDNEALLELSESIKEMGIIQPIIVKQENNYYSIIAGERRFRAARLAKLNRVPVIIKEYTQAEMLQVALIENIQRMDLNPIEEALCYKKLIDEYFFRHEDIAAKVGKSRNSISSSLSLLNLDKRVQNFIIESKLSKNHGRALLLLEDNDEQFSLADKAIEDSLSAFETEKIIKSYIDEKNQKKNDEKSVHRPNNNKYSYLENDLKVILGTKVSIRDGKNKGKIEIEYYSQDDLDRLLNTFKQLKY